MNAKNDIKAFWGFEPETPLNTASCHTGNKKIVRLFRPNNCYFLRCVYQ